VQCRTWGGNFLLNCGPAPDGTMPADFYTRCDELAAWMAHSREALIGADPTPGEALANVPMTRRGSTWYLHVLPKHQGPVEIRHADTPRSARLLRTGAPLSPIRQGEALTLTLPSETRTGLDDVVAVTWA